MALKLIRPRQQPKNVNAETQRNQQKRSSNESNQHFCVAFVIYLYYFLCSMCVCVNVSIIYILFDEQKTKK